MLKRLEHPNVVKVFCLVAENGTTMGFGMEQLGESVANASDQGQLSARRLSRAFRRPARVWRTSTDAGGPP